MKERPIIFSAPMVRAILEGRKTQTRRVVAAANGIVDGHASSARAWAGPDGYPLDIAAPGVFADDGPSPAGNPGPYLHVPRTNGDTTHRVYPIWQPGDRLWVREAWGIAGDMPHDPGYVEFRADCKGNLNSVGDLIPRWRSPIHMSRRASRITLEITDVRVQRLQEISEADCWAEGIEAIDGMFDQEIFAMAKRLNVPFEDARPTYACLWESINGKGSWEANPFVWALSFKRIDGAAPIPATPREPT